MAAWLPTCLAHQTYLSHNVNLSSNRGEKYRRRSRLSRLSTENKHKRTQAVDKSQLFLDRLCCALR